MKLFVDTIYQKLQQVRAQISAIVLALLKTDIVDLQKVLGRQLCEVTPCLQVSFKVLKQIAMLLTNIVFLVQIDPVRPYVDSSPSNGVTSLDPYTKRWGNPGDAKFGDIHFYNYQKDCRDVSTFPPAKFVSEFGYQSFPSWGSIKKVTIDEDWSTDSNMVTFRQRHPNGNDELMQFIQSHFNTKSFTTSAPELKEQLFRSWLYMAEVNLSHLACYTAPSSAKCEKVLLHPLDNSSFGSIKLCGTSFVAM